VRLAGSTAPLSLGGTGWEQEQVQSVLLAGLLERGAELTAAVDLHRADGKRHAALPGVEELSGRRGGGAAVGLKHIPARDHIPGGAL